MPLFNRTAATLSFALALATASLLPHPACADTLEAPASESTTAGPDLGTPETSDPATGPTTAELEAANPLWTMPDQPLGFDQKISEMPNPPAPEKARLGRWLFFDKRLSADATVSCASCHRPENAFSEPTPVSTGIRGQKGGRKAPSFVNAVYSFFPHQFWDGRAATLEEQAIGPMANPIEMGNTHEAAVATVAGLTGYAAFFEKAFGDGAVTLDRIAEAIAHYERTRVSGNSPYDRWKRNGDEGAVSDAVKKGEELFFGKALCTRCHVGNQFTDSMFHNLGVGWDAASGTFADDGRAKVTGNDADKGAFKTPGLRDTALHAPYMHDGSMASLREVMDHYVKGGNANPNLDPKMEKLDLSEEEIQAVIAFMEALNGEGYQDEPPKLFPS